MPDFKVTASDIGNRLDKFVCRELTISRALCKEYLDEGLILVNGASGKGSYLLKENDLISVTLKENVEYQIKPLDLGLEYYYNDEDLCVVYKPSGLVTHPAPGAYDKTLVHGLMFDMGDELSPINGVMRPGIVHRIDKDTSGLLVIAKSELAHHSLTEQLKAHTMKREYIALVYGIITEDNGRINAPIGRDPLDRLKMAVVKDGKEAITNFTVLKRFRDKTLILCRLETGRTHQIRVHMKYIGHPLVGDPLYGPKKIIGNNGQFLHAQTLGFVHPRTKEFLEFKAPLPAYFTAYLKELEEE